MEKINCNVIQDILTLYIDDSVSDDTKALVEEHLQNCEGCRRLYNELTGASCEISIADFP